MDPQKKDRASWVSFIAISSCVLINIILYFIAYKFSLPLYLDSVGTILITMLGGAFPGILTAVITNVLCIPIYSDSIFYSFVGTLIAIITATFVHRGKYKSRYNYITLVVSLGAATGIVGTLFQWILNGEPQFAYINDLTMVISGENRVLFFFASLVAGAALNIVDKGICVAAAIAIHYFIPSDIRTMIWNSGRKQASGLIEERAEKKKRENKGSRTLKFKITAVIVAAAIALTSVICWVSCSMSFREGVKKAEKAVSEAATLAAMHINADDINRYIREASLVHAYEDEGYKTTKKLLASMVEAYSDVSGLYVYQMRREGRLTVFDTTASFEIDGIVGESSKYPDNMSGLIADLTAGKKIEVQHNLYPGWHAITAYEPVFDSSKNCVAYVCAVSIIANKTLSARKLLINLTLAFAGFFVLILSLGLRLIRNNLIFPIESLENSINGFMRGIDEQDKIDESVKKLQKLDIRTKDEIEELYRSVCEMAVGTAEQMRSIRLLARENDKMQAGLIITMADMVESRDSDTGAHTLKTAAYVRIILDGLKRKGYYTEKLTDRYIKEVEMSAPLHDVGKINVSDTILNKPGKLTEEEFEIMKTHTTAGKKILENAISTVKGETYLKEAMNMAAYHHERWDGKGYPEGLHGQVIPLSARVMAVADVFDALASPRVYKPAFPLEKALQIIQEGSGTQFDPKCVEVFMDSITEVKKVLKKYQAS